MPDQSTPVAMRLATNVVETIEDQAPSLFRFSIHDQEEAILLFARALDDAGLREAVKMLDHCIRTCMALGSTFDGPGKRFAAAMQQDLGYTLFVLTRETQEETK